MAHALLQGQCQQQQRELVFFEIGKIETKVEGRSPVDGMNMFVHWLGTSAKPDRARRAYRRLVWCMMKVILAPGDQSLLCIQVKIAVMGLGLYQREGVDCLFIK